MRSYLSAALAAVILALVACSGDSSEPAKTGGDTEKADCCKTAMDLREELPVCCRARLDGGELSICCKASEADPAKEGECCKKAKALIAKVPACCKEKLSGGKVADCCKQMK